MANRVRNIVLRVPVTAQEREMIELKTQQMGTRCFSVYARIMLIDGYVFILCTDRTNVEAEYALGGLLQSGTVLAFFGAVLQVVVKPQLFETKRTSQKCEVRFFT